MQEEIIRLSELASALPQDIKPLADIADEPALFQLLDYYESLIFATQQHPEVLAVVAKALSNKKLRLADEKTAILDDQGHSILFRIICYNKYPLSLIAVVLERPEAKSLVRFAEKDCLSSILSMRKQSEDLDSPEEKKQFIGQWTQCVTAYLLHTAHSWQELFKQSMGTPKLIGFLNDQILNLLLEKMGPFPWHEKTSFSYTKDEKTCSFTLPALGIVLLSEWLACKNISIEWLEKFIGEKSVEWSPIIENLSLILKDEKFFVYSTLLSKRYEFSADEKESKDKIKPGNRLKEGLVFLLEKQIIKFTHDLLSEISFLKGDFLKECLRFLTPQSLSKDPEDVIKILRWLIKHQYPLAQIKNLLPKDIKESTSLLNTPIFDKKWTLLEQITLDWNTDRAWGSGSGDYSVPLQFLLEHGSQVTGTVIRNCAFLAVGTLLMDHLRAAGSAWYQQPQQGYEILLAMIQTQQPTKEIQHFLQLEDKDQSGVLNYVSLDGYTTFSNLLDAVQDYMHGGDCLSLVKLLVQNGASITGKSLDFLLRSHPNLGNKLLADCNFKEVCKKPPNHGASLISCIIKNLDDPIKQLQPWLESKEEKAVSAMLAYDMSETSPLSQFLAKIEGPINKAQSDFILLLLHKGAIPSGPDLHFLTSNMKEVFVPVILDSLNTQHLFAHFPEKILALLAATITLGWPCDNVAKLLDFGDLDTLDKIVNNNYPRLLPIILKIWLQPDADQNNLLQVIQLLVDKGYRLNANANDLKSLRPISLKHRSYIWTALAKAPIEKSSYFYGVFDWIDLQAPIELIQQILPDDGYSMSLCYQIIDSLNAENCDYRLTIILSLFVDSIGLRKPYGYENDRLKIFKRLIQHYHTTQDSALKKVIAAISADFLPIPLLNLKNIRKFLIERSEFRLMTADYFSQAEMILRKNADFWLPTVIVNIIWNYILPPKLEKLLLDAAKNECPIDKDAKFPFFFTPLPVSRQHAELGFCAAHAAFNAQLPKAMSWINQSQLQDFFSEDSKDQKHPCTQLVQFFLEKSHETKQGEEDGTPVHMRQLLREKSLTDEITIAAIKESKGKLSLGHADCTLSLEMFKNLLQLQQQFLSGKRVTHSFVISFNNVHWFAVSWIAKQSKTNLWLGMDSNPVTHPALEEICQLLQALVTKENFLKEVGKSALKQSRKELEPLLRGIDSAQVLLSYLNPIQALLEVYAVLVKSSDSLQELLSDNGQFEQFQEITVLLKKFVIPEIENDLTICMEIIKKLKTSRLLEPPSSAAMSAGPV